ncbi:MAG: hypothetical protein Q9167_006879, partial [Letrouitia subvulpina]
MEMGSYEYDWLVELALNKKVHLPEIQHVILSEATGNEGLAPRVGYRTGTEGLPSSLRTLCTMHEIHVDVESVIPDMVAPRGGDAFALVP